MEATRDFVIEYGGQVYFTSEELCCKKTGLIRLSPGFDTRLLALRMELDLGMAPSSCCRSFEHNREERGHPKSLHVLDRCYAPDIDERFAGRRQAQGTLAIDIKAHADPLDDIKMVRIALDQDWSVGVSGDGFYHLDQRVLIGLPQRVFGY